MSDTKQFSGFSLQQTKIDKEQELNNIIEQEIQYPEDKKTLEEIQKKAQAFTQHQKQRSPKNRKVSNNSDSKEDQAKNELDSLISAFTSPIPQNILTIYDKKDKDKNKESALERTELKGVVYREFTIHIFQSINVLQNLNEIDDNEWMSRQKVLAFTKPGITKTIIFDLDETLAHCVRTQNPSRTPDVHLDIVLPSNRILKAPFNIRPFTHKMLNMVNEYFEVICFTASHAYYADVILDYIDPEKKLIQHRLYRDSCIKATNGDSEIYIKDLRIFKNREMKDMIIVDNAVYSFGKQLSNGIPITPFKEDQDDVEFEFLINYLYDIKDYEDFREANSQAFKMELVYKFNNSTYIEEYENCEDCEDESQEDSEEEKQQTDFSDNPFKNNIGKKDSQKSSKLSKQVQAALQGISNTLAKTQSFHAKFINNKIQCQNIIQGSKSNVHENLNNHLI